MKKIDAAIISVCLLFVLLFLMGCSQSLDDGNQTAIGGGKSSKESNTVENTDTLPVGQCTPGWKCIASDIKAYQYENCSFRDKKKCTLRCNEGNCTAATKCEVGFKCKDKNTLVYQLESCGYQSEKECADGCLNDKCIEKGNETSNVTNATTNETVTAPVVETPVVVVKNWNTLNLGEKAIVTYSEKKYNLSIYNLEGDRAKLSLDQWTSDWIEEGGNFTFGVGLRVIVQEVLLQPNADGIRQVSYTLG